MKRRAHHVCIQTNDYAASLAFYKRLGFTLEEQSENFHTRDYNSWLALGTFYIELQTPKAGEVLPASNTNQLGLAHFCLWVDALDEAVRDLQQAGYAFREKHGGAVYEVEGGKLAKVYAPEGTLIELRDTEYL
ncbi:VOC family protein [Caryophanon latum]|uniref:Glyoxalase n=1 Tax=Caryophanon latum TaxID=33977 RepID=A0A1C0YUN9_9BACL|nr:VOC family protein [Caryophanon latum]OCS90876.1 glyoxalase [Caryophanon latum]